MRSNRGHIMLQKSRAKNAPKPIPSVTYYCFKCKFFSTSEDLIANHMTYLHLVPPQSVNGKFIALSNTNLLHSTFLPTSAIEEHLEEKNSSKNESNHEEDDEIFGSEFSGVEKFPEYENPCAPADNEFHYGMDDFSPNIDTDSPVNGNNVAELDNAFMDTPTPGPSHRNIVEINVDRDIALSASNAGSVVNSPNVNRNQRFTSSGGVRSTPTRIAQKKREAGKRNLIPGANKKASGVGDVGDYKTKYRATEKTKKLVVKLAKDAAMNLLKLNNTKVDGLDNEKNGFFFMYKVGGKTFIASEGIAGKEFLEDEEVRTTLISESKSIDVQLNSPLLTSLLKSQYGSGNKQNTPKSQKRKNYNGIGAQKKAKQTEVRHEASEDYEAVQVSQQKRVQKSTAKKRKNTVQNDNASEGTVISADTSITSENDENRRRWLASMIDEATEPQRPANSKRPRKDARQLFPFKCSECNAKYKTKNGFTKHMKDKHLID